MDEMRQGELVFDERKSLDSKKILQPKTVTYAKYRFSKIHHMMFIHIREELQAYISKNRDVLNGGAKAMISVPLFVSHYPHFKGDGAAFYDCVYDFMTNRTNFVKFRWRYNPEVHAEMYSWIQRAMSNKFTRLRKPEPGEMLDQVAAILIYASRCENDADKIVVTVNPMMLPFLLYYGKGVGGTCFDRDVALKLSSRYSFRLYEFISDWATSCSSKVLSLDELRDLLDFPSSYKPKDIQRRVLSLVKSELDASGSDLTFSYEFRYDVKFGHAAGSRGRQPSNCIFFTFNRREEIDLKELSRQQILVMLKGIADREKMVLCPGLAERVVEEGLDAKLKSKFYYYDKKVSEKRISALEYKNTLLKIVRELTGVDLRSEAHVRNVRRSAIKYVVQGNEPTLFAECLSACPIDGGVTAGLA